MAALPPDGDDIFGSPSEGCEGILQAKDDEVAQMTGKLNDLSLNSPGGCGESKEDEALQSSPGERVIKGRTVGGQPRAKMRSRVRIKRGSLNNDFNMADPCYSPGDPALSNTDVAGTPPKQSGPRKRSRNSIQSGNSPHKKQSKCNLSLNLGQPPVW